MTNVCEVREHQEIFKSKQCTLHCVSSLWGYMFCSCGVLDPSLYAPMHDSLFFMHRRFGEDPDGALTTVTHAPYDVKLGICDITWPLLCLICLMRCVVYRELLFASRIIIRMNHCLFRIYIYIYICMRCSNYGLVPRAGALDAAHDAHWFYCMFLE